MAPFPGADADRAAAAYALVGAPLDCSASYRPGTRFGPERIRSVARAFEDYDHHTDQHFSDLAVHDAGDVRAWADAADYLEYLAGQLTDLVADGLVPVVVGGEHTVTVAALRACDPSVYVCLDAHLDLRSELDGNTVSHATVTHHALDVADRAIILGARAGAATEWDRAASADVTAVPPDEVTDWLAGAGEAIGDDAAYLSVDIDAADPGFAPGTGTMEPFGLSPATMHDVVRTVGPHCVGFDVVEVTDHDDGQAATLAAKLLRAFVYAHAAD